MSSTALFFMAFFYLVLLLSPPEMLMGTKSMVKVVAATRPLETKSPDYETLKPKTKHGQQEFHGGEDCYGLYMVTGIRERKERCDEKNIVAFLFLVKEAVSHLERKSELIF
ncbi:hypothetical protein SADUNF_Sadunf10G0175900 [Salix dunnii]|uniref:Uncharacterized protein n=1 Tax=Salix dunnii TaxID=1413687 RepID=A0A835JUG0_9ROSI|nr:hypothetical protein SADUNF_Sadunf10G0175900 [Salix dunnii]